MSEQRSCLLDVAPVHAEPDPGSEQVTQALRGEVLAVEEQRGEWVRVRTAYDYPGWMLVGALGEPRAEDAFPPPVRAGNPLEEARAFLGAPYLWGGLTERGIDCSGLVHMAHRRLGRLVPRDADQQEAVAEPVPESDVRAGDLVFYGDEGAAHHVAFWLGDGRILHATGREGVEAVVEEQEPASLTAGPRRTARLKPN
jgi:cell wall-associated NlpC family hydrolase